MAETGEIGCGSITREGQAIPFGPGFSTLCVNDQCGYLIENETVQQELLRGDFSSILRLAQSGIERDMSIFNVQLMAEPLIEYERDLMPRLVETLLEKTECIIAVDTRDPVVLEMVLEGYPGKAMCNCVNGEEKTLDAMLPIIAEHKGVVGTALVDETGIPETPEKRLRLGGRIVEAALKKGIPREEIILDCICMPSGAVPHSFRATLKTIELFRKELGVPTLLGISNIGFGMPEPNILAGVGFIAAVASGMDVAMIDPQTPGIRWSREAIDFLMGIDPFAQGYLELYRSGAEDSG